MDELLTVEDLAQLLKVPKSWIYERSRQRGKDRLPHIRIGNDLRFEEAAVRAFIDRQRQPT